MRSAAVIDDNMHGVRPGAFVTRVQNVGTTPGVSHEHSTDYDIVAPSSASRARLTIHELLFIYILYVRFLACEMCFQNAQRNVNGNKNTFNENIIC